MTPEPKRADLGSLILYENSLTVGLKSVTKQKQTKEFIAVEVSKISSPLRFLKIVDRLVSFTSSPDAGCMPAASLSRSLGKILETASFPEGNRMEKLFSPYSGRRRSTRFV